MKIQTIILFLFTFYSCFSMERGIYYYGPNNKPANESDTIKKIEIRPYDKKSFEYLTSIRQDKKWSEISRMRFKIKNENKFIVLKYRDGYWADKYVLEFTPLKDGKLKFVEYQAKKILREGYCLTRIPLTLDGSVTEYYDNGNKKSISIYNNNQLVSNQHWLENGEEYLNNYYFTADRVPEYLKGTENFNLHVKNRIIYSDVNYENLQGSLVVGFVILDSGDLFGIQVLNGTGTKIDEVVTEAIKTLPGKWMPAVLDNKTVNCFQTYQINFKLAERQIKMNGIEFTGGNMIWY